jgi:predicted GNAT family N-acyltransferase
LGLDLTDEELAAESKEIVLGAFVGDALVGTLNLVVVLSPNGLKMRQVAVRPEMQGKGIGRALVEMSESIAQEAGSGFIKLNARDTAVPFYLALGYESEGEPFEEVGIPHRLMVKYL